MPDQQHFTAELKAEHDAPFPILTDIDNGYAMSLNLAFWVGDEMQKLMTGAGWDVSRSQGSNTWLLPIPATFVVGTDGEVKSRFVDPDYRKRVAVEDLIAALKRRISPVSRLLAAGGASLKRPFGNTIQENAVGAERSQWK